MVLHDRENPVPDPGIAHGRWRVMGRSSNAPAAERWAVVAPDPADPSFPGETKLFPSLKQAEAYAIERHAQDSKPAESGLRLVAGADRKTARGGQ